MLGDNNWLLGNDNWLLGDNNWLLGDDNWFLGEIKTQRIFCVVYTETEDIYWIRTHYFRQCIFTSIE